MLRTVRCVGGDDQCALFKKIATVGNYFTTGYVEDMLM